MQLIIQIIDLLGEKTQFLCIIMSHGRSMRRSPSPPSDKHETRFLQRIAGFLFLCILFVPSFVPSLEICLAVPTFMVQIYF